MPRLALRALVFLFFIWMAGSLLIPIATAGVFAILLEPWNRSLANKHPRLRSHVPLLLTTLAVLGVIIPLTFVTIEALGAITELLRANPAGAEDVKRSATRTLLPAALEMNIPLAQARELIADLADRFSAYATETVTRTAARIPKYLIEGFLFLVALYYFLRDGKAIAAWVGRILPFGDLETDELYSSISDTVHGAIFGTMVTALVQGTLVLIALLTLKVPGAFLWAIVAAFLSFTPVVGTAPVTGGAVIYLALQQRWAAAAIMFAAAITVGVADNIVRPWVTSVRGHLHPLLGLLSILAGLEVFGPAGIFLGPVAGAMAIWTLDTYGNLRRAQAEVTAKRAEGH